MFSCFSLPYSTENSQHTVCILAEGLLQAWPASICPRSSIRRIRRCTTSALYVACLLPRTTSQPCSTEHTTMESVAVGQTDTHTPSGQRRPLSRYQVLRTPNWHRRAGESKYGKTDYRRSFAGGLFHYLRRRSRWHHFLHGRLDFSPTRSEEDIRRPQLYCGKWIRLLLG
jgi:hypothetical protein